MPFKLRKAPKNKYGDDAYWVTDTTSGKHYSKDPMPKKAARQQLKALYASEADMKGGADYTQDRTGDAPTFDEYLASKGIPQGSFAVEQLSPTAFKEVVRADDEIKTDDAAFKANMARMKTKEEYAAAVKGRKGAQSYADYARTFEANAKARATKNLGAERRKGLDKSLLELTSQAYADYAREYPDAVGVSCNIGADGERRESPEYTTAGECKRRHKLNYRKQMEKDPFGKVVNVLSDIADTAVDFLPGPLGQAASAVYKEFAPPTSKFGKGKLLKERIIKMKRSDFEKEHRHLIKLLRTSNDPKILREAADQAAEIHEVLSGSGLFDSLVKGAKAIIGRVSDIAKGIRRDYPPDVRVLLAEISNKPIIAMNIRRDPIRSFLNTAINLITLGKWNQARKDYAYDKVFHLGVEFELGDGRVYVAEKNQTLNIAPTLPSDKDTERLPVKLPATPLTVGEMLAKTQAVQGDRYFLYDAFDNNCQDWIVDLLTANGLSTPENTAFVKQPLEGVLRTLPGYTSKVARVATDLGALASVAIKGRGRARPHPAFSKQLKEVGIKPSEYLGAVRSMAAENGYNPEDVSFSDNSEQKIAIKRPDGGISRAGRVGYGDFTLYRYMETHKKAPPGTAAKKRDTFRKSHNKIKGDWKADKFSPNSVALNVLWG